MENRDKTQTINKMLNIRLTPAQQNRLYRYQARLGAPRRKPLFDDTLLETIRPYLNDEDMVLDELKYLKGIGYASSLYDYSKVKEQLDRFVEPDHSDFRWNTNYKLAKKKLKDEFRSWNLSQLTYRTDSDIRSVLPDRDTSTGFDGILTGINKKKAFVKEDGIIDLYNAVEAQARKDRTFNNIILIGSRTQASGAYDSDHNYKRTNKFKEKSRLVSMIRIWLILAECKFAKPLQNKLGTTSWYAGGKSTEDISGLIWTNKTSLPFSVTVDYSHYDQSISSWLIHDAFEIMEAAFIEKDPNYGYLDKELLHIIRDDMINKTFIDAEGQEVKSHKGVCSGSMFTQLVDSIVNRLMIETYMISLNREYKCIIMGDDNIIFTREELDNEHLCNYLSHNFGIETNPDKCSKAKGLESPEFLSRYWTSNGVWRHPKILISKMLYPEAFRDYRKGADATLIIYAYILTFPLGMRDLIDVDTFCRDNPMLRNKLKDEEKVRYLSGFMRYLIQSGTFV